jgi:hypothetical protein
MIGSGGLMTEADQTVTSWEEQFYPADVPGRSLRRRAMVSWEDELAVADIVMVTADRSRGDQAIATWEDEFSAGIPLRRTRTRSASREDGLRPAERTAGGAEPSQGSERK